MSMMAFVCIVLFGFFFLLFICLALLTVALPETAKAIDKMFLRRIKGERNDDFCSYGERRER